MCIRGCGGAEHVSAWVRARGRGRRVKWRAGCTPFPAAHCWHACGMRKFRHLTLRTRQGCVLGMSDSLPVVFLCPSPCRPPRDC